MDLTKAMRVFVHVTDAGSFAAAAERLNTSTGAVSRYISALEEHLGARLLQRTTRRLSLTESGRELRERAQHILADLDETVAVVGQHVLNPCGHLRVSAPVSFGMRKLAPILPDFCRQYPNITLDLDFNNRVVDLVNDGIDVALRMTNSPGPELVARKITPIHMMVCAAPSYLADHPEPETPSDLSDHAILGFTPLWTSGHLVFRSGNEVTHPVQLTPKILSNNGELLVEMARKGLGALVQPDFLAEDDFSSGALVPLLKGWTCGELGLYVVYPSRAHLPIKVRVFVDHIVERLGRNSPDR
ncbi:HTH-type transcriptional regulator DmlR [Pleomorphomonas sp. T1.2MG-36]|uniref:LysR family transcriptional regulator n=1 Tax=Pleomorphomonas sp. T1.2MG-36 TaxID=3041167 RepID=UPI0024773248|nr:LysR family transcriptional regulator [Pleomorphomonas sp. T1.2MG-36]CAI9411152.1 HTH-type transcriptional regulator DmlR [Pleomorphomonas sp. T1.2MG-36]